MEFHIRTIRVDTVSIGVLAFGIALTLVAFFLVRNSAIRDARAEFDLVAQEVVETLAEELESNIAIAESIRNLYNASNEVEIEEFAAFVEDSLAKNASIQALEWIPHVQRSELGSLQSEMRLAGFPTFRVTERDESGDLVPVGPRDEYFPVTFIEPLESNEAAHGFDLGSNPIRLATLQQSGDSGKTLMTGKITLVQETEAQSGFLAFVPVYSTGQVPGTEQERHDALEGFTLGVYRVSNLVKEAFAAEFLVVGLEALIRDTTDPDNPEFLTHMDVGGDGVAVTHTDPGVDDPARFQRERTIEVGGRTWTVSLDPLPGFYEPGRQALFVAVAGAFMALAVAASLHTWRTSTRMRLKSADDLARELATMIDRANAPIFGIDVDGNINEWNLKSAEITGFSRDEAIGRNLVNEFIDEEYKKDVWRVLDAGLKGRETSNYEFQISAKSGERVLILLSATTRRDINNKIIGVLGIGQDISHIDSYRTELETLNAGLERSVEERTESLREANTEMEAFTYSVSHDLRAPLRSMDGFSLALLEDYGADLDDTAKDYLQRIRSASQRMSELIEDLLQLSRITQQHLSLEPTDLSQLVGETVTELRESDPERVVDVKITPGAVATVDAVLMRSVIQNLIGNAWKFTAEHDAANIEFGIGDENGERVYFIKDDGAGFDPRYSDKLFAPFQRLHSRDQFEGTGIGLATAYRIIQRHGGKIWAEGEVDVGATFFFTIGNDAGSESNG